MVDSGCRTCGGTGWVDIPHPTTPTMQVCPCDRRTPPTPATDEREAVDAAFHKSWCAVIDLLDRDYITPAKLREAIVPFVAAEILAAEARGRDAKLPSEVMFITPTQYVADLTTAEARGYAKAIEDAANEARDLWEYGVPAQEFPRRIRAIEHGAGK
mgnify:CR=1 FL=1